jgi:hypothetical protein
VKAQQMDLLARLGAGQGHDHVIGLQVRHPHVLRELLALDHHGIGHLKPQQVEETLGAVEIAHRDRDVIEKQDHQLASSFSAALRGIVPRWTASQTAAAERWAAAGGRPWSPSRRQSHHYCQL